jgi:protein gp37
MGANTGIQWTATVAPDGSVLPGMTFNPVIGCHRVSPGCAKCYAADLAKNRMRLDVWDGKEARPRKVLSASYWKQPLAWDRQAAAMGVRRKVFCASMADVFEDHPTVAQEREKLWTLIDATPHLDWLLLTKRPENVMEFVPLAWLHTFPKNVWVGTSVENQHWADIRIPELLRIPARVRFLSAEPLLGPVDISYWLRDDLLTLFGTISWCIAGGESGPKHRPMHPEWARSLRDQCAEANVPFFFKQNGGATAKSGGDLLDGQQYHAWPNGAMEGR